MNNKSNFIHKKDILIIISFLVAALLFFVIYKAFNNNSSEDLFAEITFKNNVVRQINILTEHNQKIYIKEADVWFEIDNHRISFVDVTCPDQICQNNGYISKPGDVSICMPKQVVLRIKSGNADTDVIAN